MENLPENNLIFRNKIEELDKEIKSLEEEIAGKDRELMEIENSIIFNLAKEDNVDKAMEESERLQMIRLDIERQYKELNFRKNELIDKRKVLSESINN